MSKEVRIGVIGMGNIGRTHIANLLNVSVSRAKLTAVVTRQDHDIPSGVKGLRISMRCLLQILQM